MQVPVPKEICEISTRDESNILSSYVSQSIITTASAKIGKNIIFTIMIKYHYALNELGEEVDISNVTKEYRKDHVFHCSYCGGRMTARLGASNTPHFAHSSDCEDCGNGESDLHKYAKRAIRNKFLSSEPFMVEIPQRAKCGAKNCIFRVNGSEYEECSMEQVVEYNLKDWGYDTCVEEATIEDYKADLLLTSSSHITRPPILIEVAVKHPCEEEKINSGLRIIELPIKTYEDIERFIKEGIVGPDPDEYRSRILARSPKFYGFAKECYSKETFGMRSLMIATLWKNGERDTTMAEDNIACSEIEDLRSDPEAFNAVIDIPGDYLYYKDTWDYIVVLAIENGFMFRGIQTISDAWIKSMKEKMTRMGVVYKILPRQ